MAAEDRPIALTESLNLVIGQSSIGQRPPLRILVVVHDFAPGGTERIALRLASQWAAEGETVALACGDAGGPLKPLLSEHVRLFTPTRPIRRSRLSRIAVASFAAHAAQTFRPDVIFLPGNFHAGMAVVLKLRLGRGCPAIVLKLSNALHRPRRRLLSKTVFLAQLTFKTAFADHLVMMSSELLDEARQLLPWRDSRYSVIPEPVLESTIRTFPPRANATRDEAPLLVAAGRLAPQKNFALLLDAVARLDRAFQLVIYGEGRERIALEARARALGVAEQATFAGYIDDIQPALAAARLFVLSSDYEGFPAVMIEALGAGVPVVATNCSPAIAGIAALSKGGAPVPPGDPGALAKAIIESLDRPPPDRGALAASVDRFRIEASAAAYLHLFRRLAGEGQ